MKKIRSGVFGLNPILDGGINKNSTTVVVGCSGAGKTTFATQFIRRGLEDGQDAVFVSLDENKEQIIREAVEMGWVEILDFIDSEQLVFIDASGMEFANFIKKELPSFVDEWEGADARIVVDPLTPVIWSTQEQYERRDLVSFMLKETRKVGTVLCTLEEHGMQGNLSGPETVIPMYLADSVIHLRYLPTEGKMERTLKVVKCRSSKHSELTHKYFIIKGLGIVVKDERAVPSKSQLKASEILRKLRKSDTDFSDIVKKRLDSTFSDVLDDSLIDLGEDELVNSIVDEYKE